MDLDDDDLIATRLDNGSMTIYGLLDYWSMKFGIRKEQIDFVKDYIKKEYERNDKNT